MKIWRAAPLGAALLLFLGHVVLAQGTVIQGGPTFPSHAPMYLPGGPSGSAVVVDSGSASGAPTTLPGQGLSELLLVGRGTGAPPFANAGTGPWGTNFCDWDGPLPNAHYLCFSANAQGGGLIAYGASGSASPQPLNCIVNGTQTPCLSSGLLAPPVIITDTQTGPITSIGATLSALTSNAASADLIESYVFCLAPGPASGCGGGNYDAVRGVGISNSGTTTAIVAGVAGYVLASQPFGSVGPSSVALFGTGAATVDSASVWGINTNVSDRQYRVAQSPGSHNRRVTGAEFDVSASYPDTNVTGILVAGNSVVQPNNSTAVAVVGQDFSSGTPGSIAKWTQAFYTYPGVATHFAFISQETASTSRADSQDIMFGSFVGSVGFLGQIYFGLAKSPNFGSTIDPSFNFNYPIQTMTGGLTARTTTDEVIQLGGHNSLSTGASIESRSDDNSLVKPLEILATDILLNSNVIHVNNGSGITAGAVCSGTPTSSFATINGIVTHC